MRAILIEDNPQIRELIKSLLAIHCPGVTVVGESESIEAGTVLLSTVPADLWLLDIELQDGTVFELLDRLNPALFDNVGMVFLTAFSTYEYVIQALQKSAVEYLLKPIDPEQLRVAVAKVQKEISNRSLRNQLDELRRLVARPESVPTHIEKIPIFLAKGVVNFLTLSDILYFEGEDILTFIHSAADQTIVSSVRNLGFYSDLLLKRGGFIRVSKKHLVNTMYIDRFDPVDGSVYLSNGVALLASRRGGQQLLAFFRGIFE